jgi:hypothetical protein
MNLDIAAGSLSYGPGVVTRYRNRIGLAVMLAGVFVTVMDASIVNVAIPSIRAALGALLLTGIYTYVRDGVITTAGLRGSRTAELIERIGAVNQTP